MTVSWIRHGHPSVLGAAAGAVAGLVAITPAAGFVDADGGDLIGFGAGVVCYFAVELLEAHRAWTTRSTCAASTASAAPGARSRPACSHDAVNPAGAEGLFYGNPEQFVTQLVAVAVAWVFAAAVTWVILKVIDVTVGLRVAEQEEVLGLDSTPHGEVAYQL